MQKIALPAQWFARAVSNFAEVPAELQNRAIPAQVPGCIHLDLLREKLIEDPYLAQNEWKSQWIGRTDWEFECQFSLPDEAMREERIELVCEGLDTVATIWVNGVEVGRSENMHVGARFDIKNALGQAHQPARARALPALEKANTAPGKAHSQAGARANPALVEATTRLGEGQTPTGETPPPSRVEANTKAGGGVNQGDLGPHQLKIRFDSAVHYARKQREKLGDLPHANSYRDENGECEPFHFIRKNACNFGWDWGPALITCGVWKAISVEAWSVARIASVRPIVRVANEKVAVVDVEVEIETAGRCEQMSYSVSLSEPFGEDVAFFETRNLGDEEFTATLFVKTPHCWWPTNYGKQPLYNLNITLEQQTYESQHIAFTDSCNLRIGLRETKLDTSPDEIGAKWDIQINGQKIWCKGANWIPDDVFLPRANDPKRLRQRLTQARDCGMNMIRVWGGGIYETDEFYAICDELGLLVWQDFLFACAAYSEDEATQKQIEAEARFNISRLQKHPSLVIWNGCNENIWGFFDWGWSEKLGGRGWGAKYYFETLPQLVAQLAPETPYWPGSPFSGSMNIHPLADQFGNKHMWDTWNEVSHEGFRRYSPRFASEFGHQAPATFSTMARAIPQNEREPYGETMLVHQKAAQGNAKLHARLHEIFAPLEPFDFDDWLYLTQLVQARAMQTAVEWFRTRSACSGALFWQLNDCWPATSWSAIDSDGHEKPLYFAAKQFFRERLLTIQPDGDGLALWAHNDSDEFWRRDIKTRLYSMTNSDYRWADFSFSCPPRSLCKVGDFRGIEVSDWSSQFLVCYDLAYGGAGFKREKAAFWFFDQDKNLEYPEPKWRFELHGNTLTIHAETLLRDLVINADRFGGRARENLVTLLPGESWSVEIEGVSSDELAKVDFSGRPNVYCANWFGRK